MKYYFGEFAVINVRAAQIIDKLPYFLSEEEALQLKNNPLAIAKKELENGYLHYLKYCVK